MDAGGARTWQKALRGVPLKFCPSLQVSPDGAHLCLPQTSYWEVPSWAAHWHQGQGQELGPPARSQTGW